MQLLVSAHLLYTVYVLDPDQDLYLSIRIRLLLYKSGSATLVVMFVVVAVFVIAAVFVIVVMFVVVTVFVVVAVFVIVSVIVIVAMFVEVAVFVCHCGSICRRGGDQLGGGRCGAALRGGDGLWGSGGNDGGHCCQCACSTYLRFVKDVHGIGPETDTRLHSDQPRHIVH